jgi:predicted DNA-binding transcriptional regulator AlpA
MKEKTNSLFDEANPTESLVTAAAFADLLQVSKRTLFRLRAKGILPSPVEISTNIIRWHRDDIRNYISELGLRKPRSRDR